MSVGGAQALRARLESGPPVILDSAMGTELERRGLVLPPPLWSARGVIERPDLVARIHGENAAAGAEILTAATFRTSAWTLGKAGIGERAAELTQAAVRLARRAIAPPARAGWVAGSIAPLEDCYRPDLVPPDAVLEKEHARHAGELARAGADILLVETMSSIRELLAACGAAARTGIPVIASVVTDGEGRLLSGEPVSDAARRVRALRPAAIGVNCVPARRIAGEVRRLREAAPGIPIAAYGNVLADGATPEEYAAMASEWLGAGAAIVGGCCGTGPPHVAGLAALLGTGAPLRRRGGGPPPEE